MRFKFSSCGKIFPDKKDKSEDNENIKLLTFQLQPKFYGWNYTCRCGKDLLLLAE